MLTIDDLFRLQNIIYEHYPEVSRERKMAIVVESGFMSGLVKTFMEISADLAFELKVFEDLALAENWIAKDY